MHFSHTINDLVTELNGVPFSMETFRNQYPDVVEKFIASLHPTSQKSVTKHSTQSFMTEFHLNEKTNNAKSTSSAYAFVLFFCLCIGAIALFK